MALTADISTVALVISIVALVVTVGQALQQYFSTAEGFRRCRKDVIGNWSTLTKRHFDWRNLRFETRFVSPQISLVEPWLFNRSLTDFSSRPAKDKLRLNVFLPIGHKDLPPRTNEIGNLPSARVSWLALLDYILSYQRGLHRNAFDHVSGDLNGPNLEKGGKAPDLNDWFDTLYQGRHKYGALTIPVATKRVISWDFMPPDVLKPFATITLHDLLVLGHRLGLDWTEVNPLDGKISAQDDYGNNISGTSIRGLGLMVTFQNDYGRQSNKFQLKDILIPRPAADTLAFGVIPGHRKLWFDDVVVATNEDCLNFASKIDEYLENRNGHSRKLLERSFLGSDVTKSGIDQLMPLISPCLVLAGCKATRVRRPHERSHIGVLEVMEGFVVFRERIKLIKESKGTSNHRTDEINWIQAEWDHLSNTFGGHFEWTAMRDYDDKAHLSTEISRIHDLCTQKLAEWNRDLPSTVEQRFKRIGYSFSSGPSAMSQMMRLHMSRAFALRERAEKVDRSKIDTYGLVFPDSPMFCAMMHLLIDDMEEICQDTIRAVVGRERCSRLENEHIDIYKDLVDSAGTTWLIWIFRAMVFNRSVIFYEHGTKGRPLIPAKWLYSQIPVHIS